MLPQQLRVFNFFWLQCIHCRSYLSSSRCTWQVCRYATFGLWLIDYCGSLYSHWLIIFLPLSFFYHDVLYVIAQHSWYTVPDNQLLAHVYSKFKFDHTNAPWPSFAMIAVYPDLAQADSVGSSMIGADPVHFGLPDFADGIWWSLPSGLLDTQVILELHGNRMAINLNAHLMGVRPYMVVETLQNPLLQYNHRSNHGRERSSKGMIEPADLETRRPHAA